MKSFHRRLRSFLRLAPEERWLAVRAIGLLAGIRLALHVLPFAWIRRGLALRPVGGREETAGEPPSPVHESAGTVVDAHFRGPRAVRRAMSRAGRTLPGSSCLARSLAAARLLRAGGHEATLTIGVARGQGIAGDHATGSATGDRILDAHAWASSDGLLVAGDAELERYLPLARFRGMQ